MTHPMNPEMPAQPVAEEVHGAYWCGAYRTEGPALDIAAFTYRNLPASGTPHLRATAGVELGKMIFVGRIKDGRWVAVTVEEKIGRRGPLAVWAKKIEDRLRR